jgi:probable HAF family extracellular repeat protein
MQRNHPKPSRRCLLATAIAVAAAFPFATMAATAAVASAPHYVVTDLGTLGGSFSLAYGINNRGQIAGFATLPGDAVEHSFVRRLGRMIDLGTLGGPDSQSFTGLNNFGVVPGVAELNTPDPDGEDFCGIGTHLTCLGFLWKKGLMLPLGTFGGPNSGAAMVNDFGVVAGYAETSVPDAACPAPQVLHYRPAVWKGRKLHSLALHRGDTEGAAFWLNNLGEVVGASGVCAAFDPRYAVPIRPDHALLWRSGRTIDLGSLGGKFNNAAFAINDCSDVVGASDLPGDTATAGLQHAFLWRHGAMADLGTLPGDQQSAAVAINNHGQVTGVSVDAQGGITGFLWQHGRMYNLNDLIPADSGMYILHGFGINDRGQVVGFAVQLATGEVHGFLANPDHGGRSMAGTRALAAKPVLSAKVRRQLQGWLRSKRIGVRLAD